MRPGTQREFVPGPAGRIEVAIDRPAAAHRGAALIAHPHPLHGGTLDNKVVQTLARTFNDLGYETWRPNFRGVGQSEGTHDEGDGEVADLAAVLRRMNVPGAILAGFSFGAVMQARLAEQLKKEGKDDLLKLVLVGIAVKDLEAPPVPAGTLVIHGELDETIPLAAVLDWARPQELPVLVIPGTEHFFHRKLHLLRAAVEAGCR